VWSANIVTRIQKRRETNPFFERFTSLNNWSSPDKAQADIMDGLNAVSLQLSSIMTTLDHINQRLLKSESILDEEYRRPHFPYPNGTSASVEPFYSSEAPRDHPSTSDHHAPRLVEDDIGEAWPGPPVHPGEPAIPLNHTTRAGLLLEWPSIRELTKHHLEKKGIRYNSEYPINQEKNRGVLIVHGRGEDSGNPDFSETKVRSYVDSFQEHILNMHPIIQPAMLHSWVRRFLDTLPAQPRLTKPRISKPVFAVATGAGSQMLTPTETTGSKRKRSLEPDGSEPPTPVPTRLGRPDRSIHSAVVLIILALGKICQHRGNVPDVVHSADPPPHDSPLNRNGGIPTPPPHASPRDVSRSHSAFNWEVIPGLEYFACATDILHDHTGAYELTNVYANIFASLYHGQLGRPIESFSFIHRASHILQVILGP
jgi:hypothetical protein